MLKELKIWREDVTKRMKLGQELTQEETVNAR
jgi:hypothetical protein